MTHVNLAHFHYGNKKNAKTLLYLLFWPETLISLIFKCFLRKLKQCKHQTFFDIGELRSPKLFCRKNKQTFCIPKFVDNAQQCFAKKVSNFAVHQSQRMFGVCTALTFSENIQRLITPLRTPRISRLKSQIMKSPFLS